MNLRPMEILLILAVLLLLFGATRLPQLGSSLGSAIRNFKKGFGGGDEPAEAPPANAPNASKDDRNVVQLSSSTGAESKDGSKQEDKVGKK